MWIGIAVLSGCAPLASPAAERAPRPDNEESGVGDAGDCAVAELRKSEVGGVFVPSPDGKRYLVNKEDDQGIAQVYIGDSGADGLTCLTCTERPGGPRQDRYKMQPTWHPSGRWVFVPVERDTYSRPPILGWSRRYVKGQLRNGLWTNMWAMSPDGVRWHRLTDFRSQVKGVADGFTGPAITRDGRRAVWSQIVDGNVLAYTFGRWELILADFEERDGVPGFANQRDITPEGMHWNEVGNFHPDDESLLLTGSVERDARGMDQYILNIRTGALTNLTNSPTVWDEHGRFSPNGEKIIFMSAHPYRDDPSSSRILSIRTEFMLMDRDGRNLTQLTHFRAPGRPESGEGGIAANPVWHPDGRTVYLRTLFFPDYVDWTLVFRGPCGGSTPKR
jgi:Tol biopolymer transport system component